MLDSNEPFRQRRSDASLDTPIGRLLRPRQRVDGGSRDEPRVYPDDVTGVPVQRSAPGLSRIPGYVIALSGLALTSGTIHIVATIEHANVNWQLSAFFGVVGVAQVFAAWRIFRRPDDTTTLKLAAVGSVVVSLLWVVSRTTGIPFGPEPGRASVGVADTITTVQQFVFAAIAVAALRRPEGDRRLGWLSSPIGARMAPALLTATMLMASIGGHEH